MRTDMAAERGRILITAVILARNEGRNIRWCLETLSWCDEIVVVDMESSDDTAAIARGYTDRIYRHPLIQDFDAAKRFGTERASGEWIFLIDADEMAPRTLGTTLRALALEGRADVAEVPFNHYIMGAKIRRSGWGYSPQPRFFRKGKVALSGEIHRYFKKAEGALTVALPLDDANSIMHFNYVDSSHFIEKLNRYTAVEAGQLAEKGARFSYYGLFRASAGEFFRRFVREKGYSEGPRGFALCLMMAFYRAVTFIKLWERTEASREPVESFYERERKAVLAGWGK